MNLLLIAYYYPPIDNVGVVRPQNMVKYLKKKGHNVFVLSCSYSGENVIEKDIIRVADPGYNNCRSGIRRVKWLFRRALSEMNNIFGNYSSIFDGWIKNIINSSEFIRTSSSPDLIISTYPPVETLQAGLYLSEKYGIPMISDFRDGLTLDPIELKNYKKFISVRNYYKQMEKEAVAGSARVLSFSEPYSKYLREKYKKENVLTVHNGYDPDDQISLPSECILEKRAINIVFTGRIELSYKYNSIRKFLESIKMISRTDIDLAEKVRFHFAGEFTKRELGMMSELIRSGMIKYYGKVNRKISLSMQRDADLLLVFSQQNRKSSVPLKYLEYLQWNKPIIALTKNNYLEQLIKKDGTGVCIDPENQDHIYNFFTELFTKGIKIFSKYDNRKNIDKYSIDKQFESLNAIFEIL